MGLVVEYTFYYIAEPPYILHRDYLLTRNLDKTLEFMLISERCLSILILIIYNTIFGEIVHLVRYYLCKG